MKNGFLKIAAIALAGISLAGVASAQDAMASKTTAKQLFKTGKRATIVRVLAPDLVPAAYQAALEQAANVQKYYEAMAVSPDEGMVGASAVHAINHHSAAAAHASAIAGCNLKKKKESKPCVVVAEFLPAGYEGQRSFSLSYIATEDFKKRYRLKGKQRAFAISPVSGHWGKAIKASSLAAARAAALAECVANAAKDGYADAAQECVVVSEN